MSFMTRRFLGGRTVIFIYKQIHIDYAVLETDHNDQTCVVLGGNCKDPGLLQDT